MSTRRDGDTGCIRMSYIQGLYNWMPLIYPEMKPISGYNDTDPGPLDLEAKLYRLR